MEVDIAIRFSDERPCRVTITWPDTGETLCMIITPAAGIQQSVGEGLREARRLFDVGTWARPDA